MNNFKLFKNFTKIIIFIFVLTSLLGNFPFYAKQVNAGRSANLIKGNSFEGDINQYWGFWTDPSSQRSYDFYRSYDAPFGFGSYSAAIDAQGNPEDSFHAILSTKIDNNKFKVEVDKKYLLIFYAKASEPLNLITYLQRSDNYKALNTFQARTISTTWNKFVVSFEVKESSDALLAFVLGSMPANSSLYIDNIQLFQQNLSLGTSEVRGAINSSKAIRINGMTNFQLNDIEIELPYYNNLKREVGTKRFKPDSINSNTAYFKMPERTFSGVARVYVAGIYVDSFNYGVDPKINEIHPALVRLDSDLIVYGSGFNPLNKNTYLVLNAIDADKKAYKAWINFSSFDSNLSQASFHLPAGIISGSMYLQTSYTDKNGINRISKSNNISYKLKPLVHTTNWSEKGYEQVGDKLRIEGRGFGLHPIVVFYDENNNLLDRKVAKILSIGDTEIIEVSTTQKTNNFNITVVSEGIESDYSESLNYLAKPKISAVITAHSRALNTANEKIPAAKIGEKITIRGLGFLLNKNNIQVEFQGNGDTRIRALVASTSVSRRGDSFYLNVPDGAVNGYLSVIINNIVSNYLPLEIIPSVISYSPTQIVPGENIIIRAKGVKDNLNLTKIHFKIDNQNTEIVTPFAIEHNLHYSDIHVKVPLNFSANNSSFALQYDSWKDDGSSVLNILPHIVSASINMDNKILSIKGYGFSLSAKGNLITYHYADKDRSIIEPRVRMLGVYPSEEGQEIRIQILDNYHYGYVSVQVGENKSNLVNFGPASITKVSRRIEYVKSLDKVMGVLYISGYNFGSDGGVKVGEDWAQVHYRNDFFIIAVIDKSKLYNNPVLVVRK